MILYERLLAATPQRYTYLCKPSNLKMGDNTFVGQKCAEMWEAWHCLHTSSLNRLTKQTLEAEILQVIRCLKDLWIFQKTLGG